MTNVLHEFTGVSMDTLVHIGVVSEQPRWLVAPKVRQALASFTTVEQICTRFDPSSELMQLCRRTGEPVEVSPLLLELVGFAVELARATDGAFDPTLGGWLEQRGFTVDYRTGRRQNTPAPAGTGRSAATFRDVRLDRSAGTITLERPLVLDLNAVAKGLAIDLAARDLRDLVNFSIEAGGDMYLAGHNMLGAAWHVGIQDPCGLGVLERTLRVSDAAVCTSGHYERGAHIVDGRTHRSASRLASVTVVAPTALVADGLSTAALVLGRRRGQALLDAQGVSGVMVAA